MKVAHEGQAVIRMKALTDEESDAAQMTFPAYVHGMLKMEAFAGAIRPDQEKAQVASAFPPSGGRTVAAGSTLFADPGRRPGRRPALPRRLSLRLHRANLEPVPAHGHHPEGPDQPGLDLTAIRDKRTNLNAQELGDAQRTRQRWKGYDHNPVFDMAEVVKIAAAAFSAWPTCSFPTAAGAGSPDSASTPRPTPRR